MPSSSTTITTPAAKRRRVDAAKATLRQPFRSPLIHRRMEGTTDNKKNKSPSSVTVTVAGGGGGRKRTRSGAGGGRNGDGTLFSSFGRRGLGPSQGQRAGDLTPPAPPQTTASTTTSTITSEFQRVLEACVREEKMELHLVRQAASLEGESRRRQPGEPVDAELGELVSKWREASRMAAEELFGLVGERLMEMGRAEKRRRPTGGGGWGDSIGDGASSRRARKGRDEDGDDFGESENEDCGGRGAAEEGEEGVEKISLLSMLRSLHIDPDLLGYDPVEHRWKD